MNCVLSSLLFASTLQVKFKPGREGYVVVVFSILMQGFVICPLVKRFTEHETVGKGGAQTVFAVRRDTGVMVANPSD